MFFLMNLKANLSSEPSRVTLTVCQMMATLKIKRQCQALINRKYFTRRRCHQPMPEPHSKHNNLPEINRKTNLSNNNSSKTKSNNRMNNQSLRQRLSKTIFGGKSKTLTPTDAMILGSNLGMKVRDMRTHSHI